MLVNKKLGGHFLVFSILFIFLFPIHTNIEFNEDIIVISSDRNTDQQLITSHIDKDINEISQFIEHTPIIIWGDNDFQTQAVSEGWDLGGTRDGTELFPYVIEGLNITGPIGSNLIEIRHSRLYFRLENNSLSSGKRGIFLHNVSNAVIKGNSIFNNEEDGINYEGYPMKKDSSNCLIQNNFIFQNKKDGMNITTEKYVTILNNEFWGNIGNGIRFLAIEYANISFNLIHDNEQNGIMFGQASPQNMVYLNLIKNNSIYGIYVEGDGSYFLNNTIDGQDSYGLYFDVFSNESIVQWNILKNNNHTAQAFDDGYENIFINNMWSDGSTLDVVPPYGIVDVPYEIDGNAINSDPEPLVFFVITDTDNDNMPDIWEELMGLNPIYPGDSILDKDNDGLTNLQEFQLGLNATNADTDNDSMPDGWEFISGLDPLVNDSESDLDNDELSNYQEFLIGTLADNNDTDNDLMTDGWEVQHSLNPLINDANEDTDNDGLTNLEEFLNGSDPNSESTNSETTLSTVPFPGITIPVELIIFSLATIIVLVIGTSAIRYSTSRIKKQKSAIKVKEVSESDILEFFLSIITPTDLNYIAKKFNLSLFKVKAVLHKAIISSQVGGFKYDNTFYPDSYVALVMNYLSDNQLDLLMRETEEKTLIILKELEEYSVRIAHFINEQKEQPSRQEMSSQLKIPFNVVEDVIKYFNIPSSSIPLDKYSWKQISRLDMLTTLILPFIKQNKLNLVEVIVGLNFPIYKIRELFNFYNTVIQFPENSLTDYFSSFDPNELGKNSIKVIQMYWHLKDQFQERISLLELAHKTRMGIFSTRVALSSYEENKNDLPYYSDIGEERVEEITEEIDRYLSDIVEVSSLSLDVILNHECWNLSGTDIPEITKVNAINLVDHQIKKDNLNTKDPMVISQYLVNLSQSLDSSFNATTINKEKTEKIPNPSLIHAQEVLCILLKLKNLNTSLTLPLDVELNPIVYAPIEQAVTQTPEDRFFCHQCNNFFYKTERSQSCSSCKQSICSNCYHIDKDLVEPRCPACGRTFTNDN